MSIVFTVNVWMWQTKAQIKSKQILCYPSVLIFNCQVNRLFSHFQVADGGRVGVTLQHDLYVLYGLFS